MVERVMVLRWVLLAGAIAELAVAAWRHEPTWMAFAGALVVIFAVRAAVSPETNGEQK